MLDKEGNVKSEPCDDTVNAVRHGDEEEDVSPAETTCFLNQVVNKSIIT